MVLSSIRQKLWLYVALVAANLLFAAVLAIALWTSRQQESDLHRRTGENLALAIERNISGTFDKIDVALQGVADSLEQQIARGKIDHRTTRAELMRLAKRLPEIDVLRYTDADGTVAADTGFPGGNKTALVADRDYFLALKDNPASGMVTSVPVLGRTSGKWVIAFARRIQHADGRFAGVVYAAVTLDYFTEVFRQLQMGPQGVIAVLDPTYAIVVRYPMPSDPNVLGKRIPQDDLIELLTSDTRTFTRIIRTHVDGVERSYSFQRLEKRPYHVTVGLGTEDAFARWWQQLRMALCVFLAFAGITTFGARQLMRSWQRQSNANQQVILEKDRYRELNQALETRVEARTEALLHANTELKQALEHLGNSEKLAALGSMVAGVAHELNTPIGNLRLAASTYQDRIVDLSAELAAGNIRRSTLTQFMADAEELVRLIDRNAERAGEMISSFKTVAVDQSSNRRRAFDLQQVVNDVLSTLRQKLKRGNCQVINAIPAGVMLNSYPGALMQIISNLVENAILHGFEGKEGGTVTIDLPSISETALELRLADDGNGIAGDQADRIFEPFYSTKIGQGGSGLGLHLVREIVTQTLGGSIALDRATNRGAAFNLHLPRNAPDNANEAL